MKNKAHRLKKKRILRVLVNSHDYQQPNQVQRMKHDLNLITLHPNLGNH